MDIVDGKWISSRLTGARGEQARLAESMGIDAAKLSKILKGIRNVQPQELPSVIAFFGEDPTKPTHVENDTRAPNGKALVPVFDVTASAGPGAVNEYEPQTHSLAFPPDYLKKLTSSSPGNLAIISVKGDSMEPTLLDDDIVLLDTSKTHLGYDGLFVLRMDDVLHVKRIGRAAKTGQVKVISDNPSQSDFEREIDSVHAIGKVLWYGRKV